MNKCLFLEIEDISGQLFSFSFYNTQYELAFLDYCMKGYSYHIAGKNYQSFVEIGYSSEEELIANIEEFENFFNQIKNIIIKNVKILYYDDNIDKNFFIIIDEELKKDKLQKEGKLFFNSNNEIIFANNVAYKHNNNFLGIVIYYDPQENLLSKRDLSERWYL